MEAAYWETPSMTYWNTITIPLRNPANAVAIGGSGSVVGNCLIGAIKVIWAGR